VTVVIAAEERTPTNVALAAAFRRHGLAARLVGSARLGDVQAATAVLGRFDVLPTLDGVSGCAWLLRKLEDRRVRVLNPTAALLAAHDKLMTALRLGRLGLPHPLTAHVDDTGDVPDLPFPVVVKPRFGSWGAGVALCSTPRALERHLRALRSEAWFRRQGVLVQECVPTNGRDLRVVVSGGVAVGGIERVAAPGEWRTNVALGATRQRITEIPAGAARVAVAAADAVDADLVGVDLLPHAGAWVVLELNGAVEFTAEYALGDGDVFDAAVAPLLARLEDAGAALPLVAAS
jgi:RimK family alpha-L-glutamate ligase